MILFAGLSNDVPATGIMVRAGNYCRQVSTGFHSFCRFLASLCLLLGNSRVEFFACLSQLFAYLLHVRRAIKLSIRQKGRVQKGLEET